MDLSRRQRVTVLATSFGRYPFHLLSRHGMVVTLCTWSPAAASTDLNHVGRAFSFVLAGPADSCAEIAAVSRGV